MSTSESETEEVYEVYRMHPVLGSHYVHAEYTRKEGARYFVNTTPTYVGELIRSEEGGDRDSSWRIDYFKDSNGNENAVKWSSAGRTCFREVLNEAESKKLETTKLETKKSETKSVTKKLETKKSETKEEHEVYRMHPVLGGRYYEHAEFTRIEGKYPNERYFVNTTPTYVGEFIRYKQGGHGDGGWRTDYFRDLNGNENAVNYSYEGRTCFREVLIDYKFLSERCAIYKEELIAAAMHPSRFKKVLDYLDNNGISYEELDKYF